MMMKKEGIVLGTIVGLVGIGLMFFEPTRMIAPFLIGFALGKLAMSIEHKQEAKN